MFNNGGHIVQPRQSFEDILLSDSLGDFNTAPITAIGTEFDLDLDQLTNSSLGISESEWDVMAQSDNILNPMFGSSNTKSSNLSFLQLSPPAMQFESMPEAKLTSISNDSGPVQQQPQQQQTSRSPSFFQSTASTSSSYHQPVLPHQSALYRPDNQTGVVQARLVSAEYNQSKALAHFEIAAAAAASSSSLNPSTSVTTTNDKEQQDHIVNSLSVSQMLAVASAYDHVCQAEDIDIGCANWLATTPDASDVEVRAVRALFNPERWNFAKDIVMRIVKIVDDLRSAVSDVPGPSNKAAKHVIGRSKKRTSPKLMFNPMNFAIDLQPMVDESSKKRRM